MLNDEYTEFDTIFLKFNDGDWVYGSPASLYTADIFKAHYVVGTKDDSATWIKQKDSNTHDFTTGKELMLLRLKTKPYVSTSSIMLRDIKAKLQGRP